MTDDTSTSANRVPALSAMDAPAQDDGTDPDRFTGGPVDPAGVDD